MKKGLTKSQFDALIKKLKKDGGLTASGVLAEAKRKGSPLHGLFDWDDTTAAHEYRLIQARQVIKRANCKIEKPEDKLVNVPSIEQGEGVYKTISAIVENISDFQAALSASLARVKSAQVSVNELSTVASKEDPDRAGILAIALKGLETAGEALEKLH